MKRAEMSDLQVTTAPAAERSAAASLLELFDQPDQRDGHFRLAGPKNEGIALTRNIADALRHLVELLAQGRTVAILPADGVLTTGAAAELLNVSRQYLVRLLDEGTIPSFKSGKHRRVRAEDLLAYREARDAKRRKALDELAQLSQAYGGYDGEAAR